MTSRFLCYLCTRYFDTPYSASIHIAQDHQLTTHATIPEYVPVKYYTCFFCWNSYKSAKNRRRHVRKQHSWCLAHDLVYHCSLCRQHNKRPRPFIPTFRNSLYTH